MNSFLGLRVVFHASNLVLVEGLWWTAFGKTMKEAIDNAEHVIANEWKRLHK